jgi:hypothetical protein
MDISARLIDLREAHPQLFWDSIIAATAAVLDANTREEKTEFSILLENVPDFDDAEVHLLVDSKGTPVSEVARLERTYEASRLVELAAIAIAGLSLYHIGGHKICDLALRRTGADYLVDDCKYLLEVAGRTRRAEAAKAWQDRWTRLQRRAHCGFFLFVVEFESFTARFGFGEPLFG